MITQDMLNPGAPPIVFHPKRHKPASPRLVKWLIDQNEREAAWALMRYAEMTRPANDNLAEPDYGEAMDIDSTQEIRPRPNELKVATNNWTAPTTLDERKHPSDPIIARCGTTRFNLTPGRSRWSEGLLTHYGDANGKTREPREKATRSKGAAKPARSPSAIERYLAMPAATSGATTLHRPMHYGGGSYCETTPLKALVRAWLVEQGVDGSVPFEIARHRAKRHAVRGKTFIAPGAEFGGVTMGRDDGNRAPAHIEGHEPTPYAPGGLDRDDIRDELPARVVTVLEIAAAGGTISEIGLQHGAKSASAVYQGEKLFREALAELTLKLPANDNRKALAA